MIRLVIQCDHIKNTAIFLQAVRYCLSGGFSYSDPVDRGRKLEFFQCMRRGLNVAWKRSESVKV